MKLSDFYVYAHMRNDNGVVFYIGKGRKHRFKTKRKNFKWREIVEEAGGFTYKIIKDNLTESEALEYEHYLINNKEESWQLVNKKLKLETTLKLHSDILDSVFYDETSPSGLRWKRNTRSTKKIGDIAGNSSGEYWQVGIGTKLYLCHRIIWSLFNGEIPEGLVVDHIDSNRYNNKISNLQAVSQSDNALKAVRSAGTSTLRNIQIINNRYIKVRFTKNGKRVSKSFNANNRIFLEVLQEAILFLESKGNHDNQT